MTGKDELEVLLEQARKAGPMTPAEMEAQRQSWVRGMTAKCEHGVIDFEQCPECRGLIGKSQLTLGRSRV